MKSHGQSEVSRKFPKLFCVVPLLLSIGLFCGGHSQAQVVPPVNPPTDPKVVYTNAEEFTYEQGIEVQDAFNHQVNDMLRGRRFDELEELARKLRAEKTRWPGSRWKLNDFYEGLSNPRSGVKATEEDWGAHFGRLNDWSSAKPQSITARVALAESYIAYAWVARGDGYSDSVSENGWKLFGERIAKAEEVLLDAKKLNEKCPEWYAAMQNVAHYESWPYPRAKALLDEATASEPLYYLYYHNMADYLQPKWNGAPGDTERFAEWAANKLGSPEGDILYFQLAFSQRCACEDESIMKAMAWERVKKGYVESERVYGKSLMRINQMAYLASKHKDVLAADDAFRRMGNRVHVGVWGRRSAYDAWSTWVAQLAPGERYFANLKAEAAKNMETPEGRKYRDEVAARFAGYAKECAGKAPTDGGSFRIIFVVKADGTPNGMELDPATPFGGCMMSMAYDHRTEKFSPAPKEQYWVVWDVDPKAVAK